MRTFLFVLGALALASGLPSKKLHPLSDEYIAELNSKQSTWKAGRNFAVEDYELFKVLASGAKKGPARNVPVLIHDESEDVPESFDAREAWPDCADIIGLIRDQSRCGACWAFAAVEAISDRICIHSNATKKLLVSAQDELTCGLAGGCSGGWPFSAWGDWHERGIVTGGLYEAYDEGCKSYFLPNCEDHPNKCTDYVDTPPCVERCDVNTLSYETEETYGQENYGLSGEKQIQLEILKNGPVEATMDIYADFASYQSGIYQRISNDYLGGHAVRILGWGVEDDVKYWLVGNSWNERWGENGYFRIIRGRDEVGIESTIDAALPDFSRF
ncbi:cathepsin B-like [Euwallacea fornicatus]|uniref:cathepsin B-like n=1 Tax=Euwallacea fornicatus TaxID=995702 RepID=UPI00338F8482